MGRGVSGAGILVCNNSALGTGEREITYKSGVSATNSEVSGTGLRTVVQTSGVLEATNSTINSTVERSVVLVSGVTTVNSSSVSGTATRVITGSGNLVSDNSSTGVGERTVVTVDGDVQGTSVVAGSGIRSITQTNNGALVSNHSALGTGVRIITSKFTALPRSAPGNVSGIAERQIKKVTNIVSGNSSALGSGTRTVNVIRAEITAQPVSIAVTATYRSFLKTAQASLDIRVPPEQILVATIKGTKEISIRLPDPNKAIAAIGR